MHRVSHNYQPLSELHACMKNLCCTSNGQWLFFFGPNDILATQFGGIFSAWRSNISLSVSVFLAPIDERLVYLAVNQRWLALIMTVLRLHESLQLSPSWIRHFTQCITRCHFFLLRWFGASANMNLSLKASAKSSPISSFCQWWVGRFWRNMRIPWEKGNRFKIIKINYRSCKKFVVNLYCEDLRINFSRSMLSIIFTWKSCSLRISWVNLTRKAAHT